MSEGIFSNGSFSFSVRDNVVNGVIPASDCKICKDSKDFEGVSLLCALKPRKRKERHESCCQERKLIRYDKERVRKNVFPAKRLDTETGTEACSICALVQPFTNWNAFSEAVARNVFLKVPPKSRTRSDA